MLSETSRWPPQAYCSEKYRLVPSSFPGKVEGTLGSDADITTRVFHEFLKKLEEEPAFGPATVARVQEALLDRGDHSVEAMKAAFFNVDDEL